MKTRSIALLLSLCAIAPLPMVAQNMHHDMGSMQLGKADENYDLRFIDAMILHHEGAIVMAKDAQVKSQRREIKELARAIMRAQTKEIAQMRQWRQAWYPQAGKTVMAWHSQMGHMMPMTSQQRQEMMMTVDLGENDGNFDLRFINAMIPHHEGALVMAKDAQAKSKRSSIKQLAAEILASQRQEIDQMQAWRKAWY